MLLAQVRGAECPGQGGVEGHDEVVNGEAYE